MQFQFCASDPAEFFKSLTDRSGTVLSQEIGVDT
jgi:hypothetical protein